MSKKVKVKGVIRLDEVQAECVGFGQYVNKYKYVLEDFNGTPPNEIEFTIKRKPKTISEYIEVNELNEKEVLEFLDKKFKK